MAQVTVSKRMADLLQKLREKVGKNYALTKDTKLANNEYFVLHVVTSTPGTRDYNWACMMAIGKSQTELLVAGRRFAYGLSDREEKKGHAIDKKMYCDLANKTAAPSFFFTKIKSEKLKRWPLHEQALLVYGMHFTGLYKACMEWSKDVADIYLHIREKGKYSGRILL